VAPENAGAGGRGKQRERSDAGSRREEGKGRQGRVVVSCDDFEAAAATQDKCDRLGNEDPGESPLSHPPSWLQSRPLQWSSAPPKGTIAAARAG